MTRRGGSAYAALPPRTVAPHPPRARALPGNSIEPLARIVTITMSRGGDRPRDGSRTSARESILSAISSEPQRPRRERVHGAASARALLRERARRRRTARGEVARTRLRSSPASAGAACGAKSGRSGDVAGTSSPSRGAWRVVPPRLSTSGGRPGGKGCFGGWSGREPRGLSPPGGSSGVSTRLIARAGPAALRPHIHRLPVSPRRSAIDPRGAFRSSQ